MHSVPMLQINIRQEVDRLKNEIQALKRIVKVRKELDPYTLLDSQDQ